METPIARIARICRYPVKGMSAEPLRRVVLAAGEGLPLDRKFALARPGAPFDSERPAWLSKRHFLMLMTDERLAALRVVYDDAATRLTIDQDGRRKVDADLRTDAGVRPSSASSRGTWATTCAAGPASSARRGTCSPTAPRNTSR